MGEYKYKVPPFLKRDGEALVFNLKDDKEFIFYVPEEYFEREDAIVIGEYVNLIGVLDYSIFDKNGRNNGLHPFYFPTVFLTKPYTIEKLKDIRLTSNSKKTSNYRALKYKYGDQIVVSVNVPQNIDNVEDFYKIFFCGKLPTTIRYDKIHNYPLEAMKLSGNNYNVSLQLFGILVSELCRDSQDVSKPFRLSGSKNMNDYQTINIKDIPKYVDTFASITSENWDKAVVGAITNNKHKNSPLEKLLTESCDGAQL